MASTKAGALAEFAQASGYGCTRFDYSGHGLSSGRFEEGTIGAWLAEAEAVFRRITRGPQIVVGSSMGGWIALLLLRRLMRGAPAEAARIAALVLIAPLDMTEVYGRNFRRMPAALMRPACSCGSDYGGLAITRALIEEGATIFSPARRSIRAGPW
jgi:pimeloyl-ACP methyl ester carboxylesterase